MAFRWNLAKGEIAGVRPMQPAAGKPVKRVRIGPLDFPGTGLSGLWRRRFDWDVKSTGHTDLAFSR